MCVWGGAVSCDGSGNETGGGGGGGGMGVYLSSIIPLYEFLLCCVGSIDLVGCYLALFLCSKVTRL